MKRKLLPINLQFFADEPETTPQAEDAAQPENQGDAPQADPTMTTESLVTEMAQLKAQLAKQKNDFDKVMSENGTLRKKLKEKQTAEEAEAEAKAEAIQAEKDRVAGLERKLAVIEATDNYLELGMDKELATATAMAEIDGDRDTVRANIKKLHAELAKKTEADIKQKYLGDMAILQSGNNANIDYSKQFNDALANGDMQAAVLAQLQQARANAATS